MKTSPIVPLLALWLCFLVVSCAVPSLHGFEDKKRFDVDPDLIGTWIVEDEKDETLYRIEAGKGKTYDLLITETKDGETRSLALRAAVVRFGDRRVVDISLSKDETKKLVEQYGMLVLPMHQFYMIVSDGDRLRVAMLEEKWIEEWPGVLHMDDMPLMAANPNQLLHILAAAARDDDAWDDAFVLTRRKKTP